MQIRLWWTNQSNQQPDSLRCLIRNFGFVSLSVLFLVGCSKSEVEILPLGSASLDQHVLIQESLAEGLMHTDIQVGVASSEDHFVLSSGPMSDDDAAELRDQLAAVGEQARLRQPDELDPHGRPLGVLVRIGEFKSFEAASVAAGKLKAEGISMAVRYTAEDGGETTGPFLVSLLTADLNVFDGQIVSVVANEQIDGEETATSMNDRYGAYAGTNAGFFAWEERVGVPGDPAGLMIVDGKLISEGINGRPALFIDNANEQPRAWIAHNVQTRIALHIGDESFAVHGVNRMPGKILNCGNFGGGQIELPVHDNLCLNDSEIVIFDKRFGEATPTGNGVEFTLDANGQLGLISEQPGTPISDNSWVVRATGERASQLREHLRNQTDGSIEIVLDTEEGPVELTEGLYGVNGGPTLLRKGAADPEARFKEGWETRFGNVTIDDTWVDPNDASSNSTAASSVRAEFYHGWVERRHPRTAVGITASNEFIVAVVYGRHPGVTAGASITEMAKLLRSLGAQEAMNLDGGGSTSMVVNGALTGAPSDLTGERTIGDALLFVPNDGL